MNHLAIKIVPGRELPAELADLHELSCDEATIVEQATEKGLPVVAFKCVAPEGRQLTLILTGRIMNAVAAAVRGVNTRIHGVPEP